MVETEAPTTALHSNQEIHKIGEKKLHQLEEAFGEQEKAGLPLEERRNRLRSVVVEAISLALQEKQEVREGKKKMEDFNADRISDALSQQVIQECKIEKKAEEIDTLRKGFKALFQVLVFEIFYRAELLEEMDKKMKTPAEFDEEKMSRFMGGGKPTDTFLKNLKRSGITNNHQLRTFYERLVRIGKSPVRGKLKDIYSAEQTVRKDTIQFPKGAFTRSHIKAIKAYLEEIFAMKFEDVNW